MSLMKLALSGSVTEEMKIVAKEEDELPEKIRDRVARGTVIIPKNVRRENVKLIGIGEGLRTKVNANVGTSPDFVDINTEIEKVKKRVETLEKELAKRCG